MIEFFTQIGNWFVANKDAIVVTLTSFATSGAAVNLFAFLKTRKITSENSVAAKDLKTALSENAVTKNMIDNINGKVKVVEDKIVDVVNIVDMLLVKINAILDVQSIVYTTIKDEKTRTAVNNILTNAKYASTEQRAKLLEQLAALKEQVTKLSDKNKLEVDEAVEKAMALVEASDKENKIVARG